MTTNVLNAEVILDLQGAPLRADGSAVLKALDRMLTLGSYYSAQHSQYLRAAEECCLTIVQAMASRPLLALEIAANGLLVEGQTIDARHRHVRQLYDLLVPLNVARLEIQSAMTPADLRQALAVLHEHRLGLGQTQGFREITIENLPPTVSTASRTVGRGGEADGSISMNEPVTDRSDASAPSDGHTDDQGGHRRELARELRSLIAGLSEQLTVARKQTGQSRPSPGKSAATAAELAAFKEALQRLLDADLDTDALSRLIGQVRSALALSHVPQQADAALRILRRELGAETRETEPESAYRILQEDLSFGVEQLTRAVSDLNALDEPVPPPGPSARADQLSMAFRFLASDTSGQLRAPALSALETVWDTGECGPDDVRTTAAAIVGLAATDSEAPVDQLLSAVLAIVRRKRPELVAPLWWEIASKAVKAGPDDPRWPIIWPHLVNDLVLGLEPAPHPLAVPLCLKAGDFDVEQALKLAPRVASLSAMKNPKPAHDLMLVPVAKARAVHAVLMRTPAADRHGDQLYRALSLRCTDALTRMLMPAVGAYAPEHRDLFAALLREDGREFHSRQLQALAAGTLQRILANLPPARRDEAWVAPAVEWLGRLAPESARSLLARIVNERRLVFFRVWPPACRRAAAVQPAPPSAAGED
jgi:hypothetical protein